MEIHDAVIIFFAGLSLVLSFLCFHFEKRIKERDESFKNLEGILDSVGRECTQYKRENVGLKSEVLETMNQVVAFKDKAEALETELGNIQKELEAKEKVAPEPTPAKKSTSKKQTSRRRKT